MEAPRIHTELLAVADTISDAVDLYLALPLPQGLRSTAAIEGIVLSWSVARNVQAFTILAKSDERLLPAAWANARAAFEIGARLLWLLVPDDPIERELRVLPLVEELARYHERMEDKNSPFSYAGRHKEFAQEARDNLARMRAQVPATRAVPARIPDVEGLLKSIGNEHLYAAYVEGSQYQHGTLAATSAYRRASSTFAEKVNLREWLLPARLSWITLREVVKVVVFRTVEKHVDWGETADAADGAIRAMAAADPST